MSEEMKPSHDCGAGIYWRIKAANIQRPAVQAVTLLICTAGVAAVYSLWDQLPWWAAPANWAAGAILTGILLRAPWRGVPITLWGTTIDEMPTVQDYTGSNLPQLVLRCALEDGQNRGEADGDT